MYEDACMVESGAIEALAFVFGVPILVSCH